MFVEVDWNATMLPSPEITALLALPSPSAPVEVMLARALMAVEHVDTWATKTSDMPLVSPETKLGSVDWNTAGLLRWGGHGCHRREYGRCDVYLPLCAPSRA